MDDYFLQMRTIADGLLAAGHSLSDDDLVLYVLGGLGAEFDAVVVSLAIGRELPSLSEVHSILHIHETRLHQSIDVSNLALGQSSTTAHVLNLATKDGKSSSTGGYKGKKQFNKPKVICQLCGKNNHVAAKCFKRFDTNFHGLENQSRSQSTFPQGNSSGSQFQAHVMQQQVPSYHNLYSPVNQYFSPSQPTPGSSDWFVDSGASHHVTSQFGNLQIHSPYKGTSGLTVGNGVSVPVHSVGALTIPSLQPSHPLNMHNVLHVLAITKNLMSVSQFLKDNHVVIEFYCDSCVVKDLTTHNILLRGTLKDGLYLLDFGHLNSNKKSSNKDVSDVQCNVVSSTSISDCAFGIRDWTIHVMLHLLEYYIIFPFLSSL